jgi:hypothetical protein
VLPLKPFHLAQQRACLRGLTMVEVLFTVLILAMLVGALGMTVQSGSGAYSQGVSTADVEAQARRMVERISRELLDADRSSLVLAPPAPFAATSVDYARCEGYAAGAMLVGPTRRIRMVLQAGEIDNGIDDNGNGLIDERRIELLPDVLGQPGQVVGWGGFVREFLEGELPNGIDDNGNGLVDERGLCLSYDAARGVMTVRVTLERMDPLRRMLTRTVETAVAVRND